MNEQIESQTILFTEMMKNNKRCIVTYSFAYIYVLVRIQLRTRSRTLAYSLATFAVLGPVRRKN